MTKNEKTSNSIVKSQYRNKYKEPDWLATIIAEHAVSTKTVKRTVEDAEGNKERVPVEVPGGVDVDKLFALAQANGISVEKYVNQVDTQGFTGRFRMTLRNMLQGIVKARHGLYVPAENKAGKAWVHADKEFLKIKGAPAEPTHDRDGQKFAVVAPAKTAA